MSDDSMKEIDSAAREAALEALQAHDRDRAAPSGDMRDIADWRDELRLVIAEDLGIHDAKHGVDAIYAGACVFNGWALHKLLTKEEFLEGFSKFAKLPLVSVHHPAN